MSRNSADPVRLSRYATQLDGRLDEAEATARRAHAALSAYQRICVDVPVGGAGPQAATAAIDRGETLAHRVVQVAGAFRAADRTPSGPVHSAGLGAVVRSLAAIVAGHERSPLPDPGGGGPAPDVDGLPGSIVIDPFPDLDRHGHGSVEGGFGPFSGSVDVDGDLGILTEHGGSIGIDGLSVEADLFASIFAGAQGTLAGRFRVGPVDGRLNGTASLGAGGTASGKATIDANGLNLSGELSAFAGAKVDVDGSLTPLPGFTVHGKASGMAGAGAGILPRVKLGWDELTVSAGAFAVWPIGIGLDGGLTIRPDELGSDLLGRADRLGVNPAKLLDGAKNAVDRVRGFRFGKGGVRDALGPITDLGGGVTRVGRNAVGDVIGAGNDLLGSVPHFGTARLKAIDPSVFPTQSKPLCGR